MIGTRCDMMSLKSAAWPYFSWMRAIMIAIAEVLPAPDSIEHAFDRIADRYRLGVDDVDPADQEVGQHLGDVGVMPRGAMRVEVFLVPVDLYDHQLIGRINDLVQGEAEHAILAVRRFEIVAEGIDDLVPLARLDGEYRDRDQFGHQPTSNRTRAGLRTRCNGRHSTESTSISSKASSSAPMAISACSRAMAAPMQKCRPSPKARCLLLVDRSMSNRSGSANTRGSRLAAAKMANTRVPAGIVCPDTA